MGKKTLSDYKADLMALLSQLPAESPQAWFATELEAAKKDPTRDVETLQMLYRALTHEAKNGRKVKSGRRGTTSKSGMPGRQRHSPSAVARKIKRVLEKHFPPPDKVGFRDKDGTIGVVTSKRFRRMDTLLRQDLILEILEKDLTDAERRQVLIVVAMTPEEALANAGAEND